MTPALTPGMQLRLWLRSAPRTHVAVTAAVALAVVVLLVASISGGGVASVRASDGTELAGGGDTSNGDGQGTSDPGATTQIDPATGAPVAIDPATGLPSPTGSDPANPTAGPTGTRSGTGGTTPGGGTTATTKAGAAAFDIKKATDRGVNNCDGTPTCVKLGFLVSKIGGLDASGFALNLRGDIQQVIQAYVDAQNKKGGLNGRPIVPVFRTVDPIDNNDQLQACTELSQDKKVFAVIDTASLIFANSQTCFIRENKTPLIHTYAESEEFMDAGQGYDVSQTRSLDRIAIEWADEIGKLGFLKGGEKVGVLEDNCEPSATVVDKLLIGGIQKYKPASVKKYQSDCTAASAQAQPPALQQQMCIDGVTHVLLATSFVAAQTFLQSADSGPCGTGARKYQYMASDYSLLAGDLFTRNFSKRQFDGSLAISNSFTGIAEPSAANKACSAVLQAAGLPGVDNTYPNADAVAICDYFQIFVKTALAVGPNLTRTAWAQAVQRLGRFDGAFGPQSTFAPGRTSGGDLVHAMVWKADCTCYRQTGPLHPGLG